MLQRTDMALWEQTSQLEQSGERLEVAFATLYPDKAPEGWEKPILTEKAAAQKPAQAAVKGKPVKGTATPTPAASGGAEPDTGVFLMQHICCMLVPQA